MSAVAYATRTGAEKAQLVLDGQACGGKCQCEKSRRDGHGLTHCLSHAPDSNPSMSVTPQAGDEAPLLRCFANCDQAGLFAAFRELDDGRAPVINSKVPAVKSGKPKRHPGPADHRYQYLDAAGELVATKSRWDATADYLKDFEWPAGVGAKDLLYGAELLTEYPAKAVLYVEGEACADAARAAGITCTITGGAGVPSREALTVLAGRHVYLFADHDTAGAKLMDGVYANLPDCKKVTRVVHLGAKAWGWDVVDFLAAHPEDGGLALRRLLRESLSYSLPYPAPERYPSSPTTDIPPVAPVAPVAPVTPVLTLGPRVALSAAEVELADAADFGFISRFATYAGSRLKTPTPEQRLLACVCVAAAVGPHLITEMSWGAVQANIWALLVGPSGANKTTRMKLPSRLIYDALPDRFLPGSSTPESLIDLLRDLTTEQAAARQQDGTPVYRGAGVTFKDEYSAHLRQIQNPGYMAGAGESLIGMYDGVPTTVSTKARGYVSISHPCLSLLAAITPHMFASVVKPGLVGGGYLARHIHQLVPKRKSGTSTRADHSAVSNWGSLGTEVVKLRHRADRAGTLSALWPDDLLGRWDEYRRFLDRELAAEERADEVEPYYQRYPEHVMKLAMLLAYAESKAGDVGERDYQITLAALAAAIAIVEASRVAVRQTVASLADSVPVAQAHRVAQWLGANGGRQSHRDTLRAMHWSSDDARKYRQTAEDHGLIAEVSRDTKDWIAV